MSHFQLIVGLTLVAVCSVMVVALIVSEFKKAVTQKPADPLQFTTLFIIEHNPGTPKPYTVWAKRDLSLGFDCRTIDEAIQLVVELEASILTRPVRPAAST